MDRHYGTSLALIERILGGKDPMVPDIGFGDRGCRRYLGHAPCRAGPARKHRAPLHRIERDDDHAAHRPAPRRALPRPAHRHADRAESRFCGSCRLFDPSIRTVSCPAIGTAPTFDNTKAREVLGIEFTAPLAAIEKAADAVLAKG
jgi:dihydroflavonol-4-reductase